MISKFLDYMLRVIFSRTPLTRLLDRYWCSERRDSFKKIGKHVDIFTPATLVPQNISLDNFTRIQNHVNMISYKGELVVKKYSAISSGTTVVPGAHIPTVGLPQYLSTMHINDKDNVIVVEEDVWVGAACILLSKCHIGRGAVVAAGSTVTKKIPPYAVVAGSPTKIIATRFTIDQILEHERILYPAEERMTREELEALFEEKYKGLKSIGTSEISPEDLARLNEKKREIGMTDYSSN